MSVFLYIVGGFCVSQTFVFENVRFCVVLVSFGGGGGGLLFCSGFLCGWWRCGGKGRVTSGEFLTIGVLTPLFHTQRNF